MSVTEFKRGVPTYKDKDDNEYGLLCETKEVCVTDNDGVSLEYKLQNLLQNINNIISGVNQVGNAKTLDGHGAEYFAPLADLANYLPRSGGTVIANGHTPLKIKNTGGNLAFTRWEGVDYDLGSLGFSAKDIPAYRNSAVTAIYPLLHTGNMANHVLPLTGGTVANAGFSPIMIKRTNSNANQAGLQFYLGDSLLGSIAVKTDGSFCFYDSSEKSYTVLHTGNSSKVVISQTAPSDTSALWVW